MPARIISVINMKGGVGKSTTTVSLAETLAHHQRRRVLVIDLDPQTNASIMVAGPEKWNALREKERTLDFYFESYVTQQKAKPFKQLLEHKVTDLKQKPDVSLCAAAPEFLDRQTAHLHARLCHQVHRKRPFQHRGSRIQPERPFHHTQLVAHAPIFINAAQHAAVFQVQYRRQGLIAPAQHLASDKHFNLGRQ